MRNQIAAGEPNAPVSPKGWPATYSDGNRAGVQDALTAWKSWLAAPRLPELLRKRGATPDNNGACGLLPPVGRCGSGKVASVDRCFGRALQACELQRPTPP